VTGRRPAEERRRVAILGATGSIGQSALDVVRRHPDRFAIASLSTRARIDPLLAAAREFGVSRVAVTDPDAAKEAEHAAWPGLTVLSGDEAAAALAGDANVDVVLNALVGAAGLVPTLRALEAGHAVALANKESLVLAGELVTATAREHGAPLLPVDSEHSGLFQCLDGRRNGEVRRLWLTASGGALRDTPLADIGEASPEQVLAHPTWRMGPRITVDCATLLNKGFEVIETHWLFDVPYRSIDVVVHPQSLVHAFVELADGSLLAQISAPDMRIPIQYALGYPERYAAPAAGVSPHDLGALTFREPDMTRYPCLALARSAGEAGGTMPAALNAADEVLVSAFLNRQMSFAAIARGLEAVLARHTSVAHPRLHDIANADAWAREEALRFMGR
jgi:1-deoxy-D-xylulose-5-phosphate reductoisomerase